MEYSKEDLMEAKKQDFRHETPHIMAGLFQSVSDTESMYSFEYTLLSL